MGRDKNAASHFLSKTFGRSSAIHLAPKTLREVFNPAIAIGLGVASSKQPFTVRARSPEGLISLTCSGVFVHGYMYIYIYVHCTYIYIYTYMCACVFLQFGLIVLLFLFMLKWLSGAEFPFGLIARRVICLGPSKPPYLAVFGWLVFQAAPTSWWFGFVVWGFEPWFL